MSFGLYLHDFVEYKGRTCLIIQTKGDAIGHPDMVQIVPVIRAQGGSLTVEWVKPDEVEPTGECV